MQFKNLLKVGDTLRSSIGVQIRIEKVLSAKGGQGFVYLVDYGGTKKVLKWYRSTYLDPLREKTVRCDWQGSVKKFTAPDQPNDKTISTLEAFYNNLAYNAKNKPANLEGIYIWPQDVTPWHSGSNASFGYIMDLIDTKRFKELGEFYMFSTRFASRHAMLTCCLNIVEAFKKLHLNGMSYQDLNDGNIFIDSDTGEIHIADNDNVTPNEINLGVGGKDRYMAPEVVLGNAPDKYSDRFSLAVILFRIMMGSQHPLEGEHSARNTEKVAYGTDPVFIFDEKDRRNAPRPETHKNVLVMWPQYPDYIKDLFKRTFTCSIVKSNVTTKNPMTGETIILSTDANRSKRPLEEEWIKALVQLRGEMVDCPKCKKTPVFLSIKHAAVCPSCKTQLTVPCKVKCGHIEVPIVPNHVIYRCQFDPACREFDKPIAKLLVSSVDKRMAFGNMSEENWRVEYPDGKVAAIPARKIAEFKVGMKIHMGTLSLEITK